MKNQDKNTVEGFGDEWLDLINQIYQKRTKLLFDEYFSVFPWENISKNLLVLILVVALKMAKSVAPKVKSLFV